MRALQSGARKGGGGCSPRCRDPDRAGFTLVEVVIAVLVSAMMVTAFFSVALTSRMTAGRTDHKQAATQEAKKILELLRNYVTDPAGYGGGWLALPGSGQLPGDTCGCYALQAGIHNVTSLLDSAFVASVDPASPPTMVYTVTNPGSGTCPSTAVFLDGKCVKVVVTWQERSG